MCRVDMRWKDLRKYILRRDKYKCRYCGISLKGRRIPDGCNCYEFEDPEHNVVKTVDHVIPRSRGGKNTKSNLVACCEWCNSRKGNKIIKTKYANR